MTPPRQPLHIGIVGAAGRGRFASAPVPGLRVHALCDLDRGALDAVAAEMPGCELYTDYAQMLERARLDAVVVGTPMPLHVSQSIAALRRGLHVLSEVPAGVSLEECRELVAVASAAERGAFGDRRALYMLAENLNYYRPVRVVTEMVRRGLFGTPYYAEGQYLHELKARNELTPWRRRWQTGINGITYGTHSLGPILRWMPGDRVESVCCAGSGHHYRDPRGAPYEMEDTCVMLCRMRSGGLAKVRLDMLSDGPRRSVHRFVLQGTDGLLEAHDLETEAPRVWLRARPGTASDGWRRLDELEAEFLPETWRQPEADAARGGGHGGSDLVQLLAFRDAALSGRGHSPLGIHEAMDMTLPGLVSQQSIAQGGAWLPVPDSRLWEPRA